MNGVVWYPSAADCLFAACAAIIAESSWCGIPCRLFCCYSLHPCHILRFCSSASSRLTVIGAAPLRPFACPVMASRARYKCICGRFGVSSRANRKNRSISNNKRKGRYIPGKARFRGTIGPNHLRHMWYAKALERAPYPEAFHCVRTFAQTKTPREQPRGASMAWRIHTKQICS